MKLTRIILVTTIIIFSAIITGSAEEKQAAVLESISYQNDGVHGETVNFTLNGNHLPKIFTIKGENPRLVFDFLDTGYSDSIHSVIETDGELVKRVRVGLHSDPVPKTRVVVDIAPGTDFAYEHDFISQHNILAISIFNPDKEKPEITSRAGEEKTAEHEKQEAAGTEAETNVHLKKEKTKRLFAVQDTAAPAADKSSEDAEVESEYPSSEEVFQPEKRKKPIEPVHKKEEIADQQMAADRPILFDVSFDGSSNKGEMVKFKLNEFHPPIVFGIEEGNPKVVCDFLDTTLAEDVQLEIESKGVYVDHIRTEKLHDPEKIRVVLDMLPYKNYDLQQVFFKEENLFVIIVNAFNVPAQEEMEAVQEKP